MKTSIWISLVALAVIGCTTREKAPPSDSTSAAPAANADSGSNAGGGTLPTGYTARTDQPDENISGARYVGSGSSWEVTTGPAHILYAPTVVGNGAYTVSATIEQLEAPAQPEAYGIFFGGSELDNDKQTYTYFLVRGTGDLAVKVREGGAARDVLKWSPSADVPKADASGKVRYDLSVQVAGDAVKFLVNGKQAASVSRAGLPTDGIAGLRINHNLRLKVTPVSVKTP